MHLAQDHDPGNPSDEEERNVQKRIITTLAAMLLALAMLTGPAAADPPPVPGPGTHEHMLVVPGNGATVDVGPPACRVPQAERGARNFHLKVHSTMAGAAPTTQAGLDVGFALGFPGCL